MWPHLPRMFQSWWSSLSPEPLTFPHTDVQTTDEQEDGDGGGTLTENPPPQGLLASRNLPPLFLQQP